MLTIRLAAEDDLAEVLRVEREAFGGNEEAELVEALLRDPSAAPSISLIAEIDGLAVGHVLFTCAGIDGRDGPSAALLAPLAVVPAYQRCGIGGALVDAGLQAAREQGAVLVFVLGHAAYYPRFGFEPALPRGLEAPYPIPAEVSDAWMVVELKPGALRRLRGSVRVARSLMNPGYWRE